MPGTDPTYWLYSVLVPEHAGERGRDTLLAQLDADGIDARALWRPLHDQPPLRGCPRVGSGTVGDDLFARGVSLPSSPSLRAADQARVLASIERWCLQR